MIQALNYNKVMLIYLIRISNDQYQSNANCSNRIQLYQSATMRIECESNPIQLIHQSNRIQCNLNPFFLFGSCYDDVAHTNIALSQLHGFLIHCILSFIRTCHIAVKSNVALLLVLAHARTREWTMWAQGLVSWPKHVVTKKPLVI